MKKSIWYAIIAASIFFGCEQEEFISPRDYPFIESLGVTQINPNGATIEAEILKEGSSSITEYGVYFNMSIDNPYAEPDITDFQSVAISGKPDESIFSVRIDFDLVDQTNYFAKPYVKMGETVVLGKSLTFLSQGVHSPVIDSVSTNKLFEDGEFIIYGDFFHSELDRNWVEVPGLEDYYKFQVTEVSRNEMKVYVDRRYMNIQTSNNKFDLVVNSAGKKTVLPEHFSFGFPVIEEISPLKIYSGDRITMKFSESVEDMQIYFQIMYDGEFVSFIEEMEVVGNEVRGILGDTAPGEYLIKYSGGGFTSTFSQPLEVLSSWETVFDDISAPNFDNHEFLSTPDRLLAYEYIIRNEPSILSYTLGSSGFIPLTKFPNSAEFRRGFLSAVVDDRYFYFGLGTNADVYNNGYYKDFYRFDLNLGTWTKLKDFPFDYTMVTQAFEYEGKLYVVMNDYLNYRIYDPIKDSWEMSPYQVIDGIRKGGFEVVDDVIYYLNNSYDTIVKKLKIGSEPVDYLEIKSFEYGIGFNFFNVWEKNKFMIGFGSQINMVNSDTKESFSLQPVYESSYSSFIPWDSKDGFLMAFPRHRNTYEQENKIYKLIQPFD